ncbi:MAG: VOC family protein [Rhodobacteraceae bacterium]|nr:VOC family protein [Paracoccaceae bacterium]
MSFQPQNAVVWSEIHVRNLDAAADFYGQVTGMDPARMEMFGAPVAIFGCMNGAGFDLQEGEPGNGSVVYIAAEGALAATMDRVRAAGGEVLSDAFEIPSGAFFKAKDPDGNVVGFFENA